ncbi:MAG: tetratricopeptide repeat protein, partial [Bdellovibrio bacteriovorus]
DYYVRNPIRPPLAEVQGQGSKSANPHAGGQVPRAAPGSPGLDLANVIPQSIEDGNPILIGERADSLFAERRYREAVPLYRRVLELTPDDVETYNDLGLALHYIGDSAGALEVLRAGAAGAPDFQRIWLTLGFVSLQVKDQETARVALTRARDLGPETSIGQEAVRLLGLADTP